MAKDRLSLEVQAQPVNTYTAPVAAAAQLYDEASVRYALQLSDAFREFSQTAATLASTLKRDQNEEDIQAGIQTVRENQMSFADLVKQGKIKPAENPWIAIGAQQASGALEGTKARAELHRLMEQQAVENPKFYDDPKPFEALVSSYATNKASAMGQTPFESKAFFESLDPYVASLRLQHEDRMIEERKKKVSLGVGAAVANSIDDFISPDENIRNLSVNVLQEKIDEMGRIGGYSQTDINRMVIDNFVGLMAAGEYSEKAEQVFNQVRTVNGAKISEIEYAKMQMAAARGKIEANRNRLTLEEAEAFDSEFMGKDGVVDQVVNGKMTLEEAQQTFADFANGPSRRISITGAEYEQKKQAIARETDRRTKTLALERERENQNTITGMIHDLSTHIGAGYDDEESWRGEVGDRIENTMNAMGFDEMTKEAFRGRLDQAFTQGAKDRRLQRLRESQQVLWYGSGTQQGLLNRANAEINTFMTAPADKLAEPGVINISDWKGAIDFFIESNGDRPDSNSESVKAIYKDAYTQLDRQIQAYEERAKTVPAFRGTLAPLPDDDIQTRTQKADIRARSAAIRMQMGIQFDDRKESSRLSRILLTKIGPGIENQVPYELEDALGAFALARQNNYPLSTVIAPTADGPVGKEMLAMLEWATSRMITTKTEPAEVLKDMAQTAFFGRINKLNLFDTSNPLDFTNMKTTGTDARSYQESYSQAVSQLEMTNADAGLYPLTIWRAAYSESLINTANHRQALKDAEAALSEKTMALRGSVVPAGMVAKGPNDTTGTVLDEKYLSFWLDRNFPGKNATLVVISMNADGSPVLAVRDQEGNSVRGSKGTYSTRDLAMKPEYLKDLKSYKIPAEQQKKSPWWGERDWMLPRG